MSRDILARIRDLIALASAPDLGAVELNEARNAALLAVRLIREHGVVLHLPPDSSGPTLPLPSKRAVKRRKGIRAEKPRKFKAKYRGVCYRCAEAVEPGDSIYWSESEGAVHSGCFLTSKS